MRFVDYRRPAEVELVEAPVLESVERYPGCWLLRLELPSLAPRIGAGQFLHVKPSGALAPYLRRPFSVYDVPEAPAGAVDLLYAVVGGGTAALAALRPGDRASVLGPLGRTFDYAADGAWHLLVAGGIGVAPFPDLAKRLIAAGAEPARDVQAVLGARTARALFCRDDYERLGVPFAVATDDGSAGFHGNAVALAGQCLDAARARDPGRPVRVYGCGPEPMLRALQALCVARGVPGQLSIDRRMACGLGICRSCVVAVADAPGRDAWHFETVCREGPIFDTATLRW